MDELTPYIKVGSIYFDTTPKIEPSPDAFGWRSLIPKNISVSYDVEPTEHMQAVFQEYLADGRCEVTIVPEHPNCKCYSHAFVSRRRPRPRNTRIQRVQAKRKALNLDVDGRYYGIRTRRDSLAYALAVEDWINGKRSVMPRRAEFRYIPARVRRKEKRRTLKWKPLEKSPYDKWWLNAQEEERARVEQTFEDMAMVMDMSVSAAQGAFITAFNAYGKEEAGSDRKP